MEVKDLEKKLEDFGYENSGSNQLVLKSSRKLTNEISNSLRTLNEYSKNCDCFGFSANLSTKNKLAKIRYGIGKSPPERDFFLIYENDDGGSDLLFVDQTTKWIYEEAVLNP